ncbi:hypothetical protein [Oceanobacillus bengalensis]|uniref:Uncharacterized protein n=1 Tax=Oceanobacillus bengalensis TaxID=1435466 RepID=A0A494Z162_9BACI|nr:hypothetical protein [Oceanobacillus bengalensis]RKQ15716.1 hypothetical protein D8M05_09425 [Oceanobacillus bengalensis]
MNKMIINEVRIINNRIEVDYTIHGEWKRYFHPEENFFVEYSKTVDQVPKGIMVIPFLCNILPVAWVFDAEVIVEELDKDFYESIDEFKQGYINMYPGMEFMGKITVNNIKTNKVEGKEQSAVFFSGGVDAYQTLLTHLEEKPTLVTIWGADVPLEDTKGWKKVQSHTIQAATDNHLDFVSIRSSFRTFLHEDNLSQFTYRKVGDGWWRGFQHGIGLIGQLAPYAFQYNIKNIYIASSFSQEEKGKYTLASDPTIDNFVRYNGCQVMHDGYEFNRQAKIKRICSYVTDTGNTIQLRVCWQSSGGSNCCQCDKCYRTILGILAEKGNPHTFGFQYNEKDFSKMIFHMRTRMPIRSNFRYQSVQDAFRRNYSLAEMDQQLRWFYQYDIHQRVGTPTEFLLETFGKFLDGVQRIKRKAVRVGKEVFR